MSVHEYTQKLIQNPPSSNPEDWYVVGSKSGKDTDGFPMGEFLCPTLLDVSDCIEKHKITDPLIMKYKKNHITGKDHCEF